MVGDWLVPDNKPYGGRMVDGVCRGACPHTTLDDNSHGGLGGLVLLYVEVPVP